MIEITGVDPDPNRLMGPSLVDRPTQKIQTATPTDKLWRQTEVGDLDLVRYPTIEFTEAGRDATNIEHVNLNALILNDLAKIIVAEETSFVP